MKAPKTAREPQPPPQTRPIGMFTLPGRADPLEIIVAALNATGADGVGRILDYRELDRGRGRFEP
jgi:hypothetical protein